MIKKRINSRPFLVPIKHLYRVVITAGDDVRHSGMDSDVADVVSMVFNCFYFFGRVVVEHSDERVICTDDDPLFSRDKLGNTHWSVRNFKGSYLGLCVPVVYGDATCIESNKNPGQCGMQVYALDSVGTI